MGGVPKVDTSNPPPMKASDQKTAQEQMARENALRKQPPKGAKTQKVLILRGGKMHGGVDGNPPVPKTQLDIVSLSDKEEEKKKRKEEERLKRKEEKREKQKRGHNESEIESSNRFAALRETAGVNETSEDEEQGSEKDIRDRQRVKDGANSPETKKSKGVEEEEDTPLIKRGGSTPSADDTPSPKKLMTMDDLSIGKPHDMTLEGEAKLEQDRLQKLEAEELSKKAREIEIEKQRVQELKEKTTQDAVDAVRKMEREREQEKEKSRAENERVQEVLDRQKVIDAKGVEGEMSEKGEGEETDSVDRGAAALNSLQILMGTNTVEATIRMKQGMEMMLKQGIEDAEKRKKEEEENERLKRDEDETERLKEGGEARFQAASLATIPNIIMGNSAYTEERRAEASDKPQNEQAGRKKRGGMMQ